jgi:hypothetical protein
MACSGQLNFFYWDKVNVNKVGGQFIDLEEQSNNTCDHDPTMSVTVVDQFGNIECCPLSEMYLVHTTVSQPPDSILFVPKGSAN